MKSFLHDSASATRARVLLLPHDVGERARVTPLPAARASSDGQFSRKIRTTKDVITAARVSVRRCDRM